MCPTQTEADRRERRVRGFLDTITEIATEAATKAAKAELGNLQAILKPGAIVRVDGATSREAIERALFEPPPPAQFVERPGKHLSPAAVDKMRALRLLLRANNKPDLADLLTDAMGW